MHGIRLRSVLQQSSTSHSLATSTNSQSLKCLANQKAISCLLPSPHRFPTLVLLAPSLPQKCKNATMSSRITRCQSWSSVPVEDSFKPGSWYFVCLTLPTSIYAFPFFHWPGRAFCQSWYAWRARLELFRQSTRGRCVYLANPTILLIRVFAPLHLPFHTASVLHVGNQFVCALQSHKDALRLSRKFLASAANLLSSRWSPSVPHWQESQYSCWWHQRPFVSQPMPSSRTSTYLPRCTWLHLISRSCTNQISSVVGVLWFSLWLQSFPWLTSLKLLK